MKRITLGFFLAVLLLVPRLVMAQEAFTMDPEVLVQFGERDLDALPVMDGLTPAEAQMVCGKYFIDSPNEPDGKHRLGMMMGRKASDPQGVGYMVAFEYQKFHVIADSLKRVPTVTFVVSGGDISDIELRISPSDLAEAVCLQELAQTLRPPTDEARLFKIREYGKTVPNSCGNYFIDVPDETLPHLAVFLEPSPGDPSTLRSLIFPKWKIKPIVERGKTVPTVQCFLEGRVITTVIIRMTAEELANTPCLANIPPKPSSVE